MSRFSELAAPEKSGGDRNVAQEKFAAWGLAFFVLFLSLSPRLRVGSVGGKSLDLRLQDLLLPVLVVLVLALLGRTGASLTRFFGPLLWVYVGTSLLACGWAMAIQPDSAVRALAFFIRGLELLFIAWVAGVLVVAAGRRASRYVYHSIVGAGIANGLWVIYQLGTGVNKTLVGGQVGDEIFSYGPKLIGEPSAFGTGFFFLMVVSAMVAGYRSGLPGAGLNVGIPVSLLAILGVTVAESRVTLAATLLIAVVGFLKPINWRVPLSVIFVAGVGGIIAFFLWVTGALGARFTTSGTEASADYRAEEIWKPLLEVAYSNLWLGVGPGTLGTSDLPFSEAHNFLLRSVLDYGLLAMLALVGMLVNGLMKAGALLTSAEPGESFGGYWFISVTTGSVVTGMFQDSFVAVMSSQSLMVAAGFAAGSLSLVGSRNKSVNGIGSLGEGSGETE